MTLLLAPFQYLFMIEAMVVAALIGGVCAVLSCYLVLKGWSLMGDAVAHSVLPGIVVAYCVGIPLAVGAFCSGLLCAVSTGWIKGNSRIKEDTVMGVVFTGLFAIGLVLFTKIQTDVHLNHILFGSLLGIERHDLIQAVVTAIITLVAMLVLRKDLLLYLFDRHQAKASGLNPTFLHYCLLCLLAATIVAALQAVGIILTVAMLITPGCIAFLVTDSFDKMLWVAALSAIGSSVVGTYISYFLNGSTGACIVLSQAMVFVLALLFSRDRSTNPILPYVVSGFKPRETKAATPAISHKSDRVSTSQ
jgi:ABC-type Mn2+/Zn2+ transport system permease subunit